MQKRPRVDRSDCRTIVKSDKKRPFGVGLTLNYQLATFDKFRRAGYNIDEIISVFEKYENVLYAIPNNDESAIHFTSGAKFSDSL